ncbi:hypothetical protein F4811DRAFT_557835 [Daldinia bambusicola]|nr:hypothetical protein F4811DRAFT_557835 [Daldinia bambusicola]
MDSLKKFAAGNSQASGNTGTQQSGEKKDIGDRIAGFINKKEGNKLSDQQLETGTDKARNMYEKATGSQDFQLVTATSLSNFHIGAAGSSRRFCNELQKSSWTN